VIPLGLVLLVLAPPALAAEPMASVHGVEWGPCIDGRFEIRSTGEARLADSIQAAASEARLAATRTFMREVCPAEVSREQEALVSETGNTATMSLRSRTLRRADCDVRLLREVAREMSGQTIILTLALSVPGCGSPNPPGGLP